MGCHRDQGHKGTQRGSAPLPTKLVWLEFSCQHHAERRACSWKAGLGSTEHQAVARQGELIDVKHAWWGYDGIARRELLNNQPVIYSTELGVVRPRTGP